MHNYVSRNSFTFNNAPTPPTQPGLPAAPAPRMDCPSSASGEPSQVIWIGNIRPNYTEQLIVDLLSECPPSFVALVTDKVTGQRAAYGFLIYNSVAAASAAISRYADVYVHCPEKYASVGLPSLIKLKIRFTKSSHRTRVIQTLSTVSFDNGQQRVCASGITFYRVDGAPPVTFAGMGAGAGLGSGLGSVGGSVACFDDRSFSHSPFSHPPTPLGPRSIDTAMGLRARPYAPPPPTMSNPGTPTGNGWWGAESLGGLPSGVWAQGLGGWGTDFSGQSLTPPAHPASVPGFMQPVPGFAPADFTPLPPPSRYVTDTLDWNNSIAR